MLTRSRAVAALLLAASLAACTFNPATGKREFSVISRDEEVAMGISEGPKFAAEFGGKVNHAELQTYVSRIGQALAAKTEGDYPSLPWEFTLLDSDVINAFALPGGKIFLTRGLARQMTNEAQLAAVLGHEVGHVTARHINSQMSRQGLTSLIIGVAAAASGQEYGQDVAEIGQQVGGVVLLKFGRDQESQADEFGMRYMSKLNYDPKGALEVMQILQRAMAGGRQPELLSTHPYPETRMERIQQALGSTYRATQGNPQFSLREGEFRTGFLPKLNALPAAKHPGALKKTESGSPWNGKYGFCGLCMASGGGH